LCAPERIMATRWQRSLRQVPPRPGLRAIESANANSLQCRWLEVRCVYGHGIAATCLAVLVVRDAAAALAAEVEADLASPGVSGQAARWSGNAYGLGGEVGPQRSVTTTNRAIAACHSARQSRDLDSHGTTMTGSGHGHCDDSSDVRASTDAPAHCQAAHHWYALPTAIPSNAPAMTSTGLWRPRTSRDHMIAAVARTPIGSASFIGQSNAVANAANAA
jgi:hypothetical protein